MKSSTRDSSLDVVWPPLSYADWRDCCHTLHRMTQVIGKLRLALEPMMNHWWQVPLYVSVRGLTTSAMPVGTRLLEVEFDFVDHLLRIRSTDRGDVTVPLTARPLASFYRDVMAALASIDVEVDIWCMPVEIAEAVPIDEDEGHASYDPLSANTFWRILVQSTRLLREFRSEFIGKASPVHFFWGSFDLAVTRFSGRTAPPFTGSAPNLGDWVMRESYSHEVASVGFWPGNDQFPHAAFYAYAYPEPAGYGTARVGPAAARYDGNLREFLLTYDDVLASPDPDAAIREFLASSYAAAADLGQWDRVALERGTQ